MIQYHTNSSLRADELQAKLVEEGMNGEEIDAGINPRDTLGQ
jgi:hypothetical protein